MNKNELGSALADEAKISKADAQSAVDAVFSVITGELKNGPDVRLPGFGNFSVSRREAFDRPQSPDRRTRSRSRLANVPKFSAGKRASRIPST